MCAGTSTNIHIYPFEAFNFRRFQEQTGRFGVAHLCTLFRFLRQLCYDRYCQYYCDCRTLYIRVGQFVRSAKSRSHLYVIRILGVILRFFHLAVGRSNSNSQSPQIHQQVEGVKMLLTNWPTLIHIYEPYKQERPLKNETFHPFLTSFPLFCMHTHKKNFFVLSRTHTNTFSILIVFNVQFGHQRKHGASS